MVSLPRAPRNPITLRDLITRARQKRSQGQGIAYRSATAGVLHAEIHNHGSRAMKVPGAGKVATILTETAAFSRTRVCAHPMIGGCDIAAVRILRLDG